MRRSSGVSLSRRELCRILAQRLKCDARRLTAIGILLTGLACFAVFSWVTFEHQERYRPCCDASSYSALGVKFQQDFGVAIRSHEMRYRTFAYPYFLSRAFHLADAFNRLAGVPAQSARGDANRRLVLAWLQGGLYLAAVSILLLSCPSRRWRLILATGLLGCVWLFPYLSISLTDGISVVVLIGLLAGVASIFRHVRRPFEAYCFWFVCGALVGSAVTIRPANIYMCFPLLGALALWARRRAKVRPMSYALVACVVGAMIPLTYQLFINVTLFGEFTILPTAGLGEKQVEWGQQYLKYGTFVSGSGVGGPMHYPNPWFDSASGITGLRWYFTEPWAGFKTVFFHVFGALDFDHLYPYVYALESAFRLPLFILGHSVVFFGVLGCVRVSRDARAYWQRPSDNMPFSALFAVFSLSVFSGWFVVYGLSAVENRFALPLMALLFPLALSFFFGTERGLWSFRLKTVLLTGVAYAVYITAAWRASVFLEGLKLAARP